VFIIRYISNDISNRYVRKHNNSFYTNKLHTTNVVLFIGLRGNS
jgi:hypothetical protein